MYTNLIFPPFPFSSVYKPTFTFYILVCTSSFSLPILNFWSPPFLCSIPSLLLSSLFSNFCVCRFRIGYGAFRFFDFLIDFSFVHCLSCKYISYFFTTQSCKFFSFHSSFVTYLFGVDIFLSYSLAPSFCVRPYLSPFFIIKFLLEFLSSFSPYLQKI